MPVPPLPETPIHSALAHHGGRLSAAQQNFPDAPAPWLDLSTGINPHGYPVEDLPAAVWRRLPDHDAEAALEASARACYHVPKAAGLVAAPGTQALIQILPHVRPARRVAVWGFGYQEHPAVWRAAGADLVVVDHLEDLATAEVAVVVSPNNPDGRRPDLDRLLALSRVMAGQGGTLVVDEAFADVLPADASVVPRLSGPGTLVLRSFGKFFGLAGLRLGFAIGDPMVCDALRTALGLWAVSGPALAVGARALADGAWQAATRRRLSKDARRLDALLTDAGLSVLGGTPLFLLVGHPQAPAIFRRLGRAGILVRPFAHEPCWLRFGLPGDEPAWHRLTEALAGRTDRDK